MLFEALSKQLYVFVKQGCPDLRQFFLDLKSSGALDVADLVSMERMETEYADLPAQKNYWNDKLERALADLECYIKVSILAKPKGASFEQDDAIYVLNNDNHARDMPKIFHPEGEHRQEPLSLRPLNHQNSHFTLLEINEKDRMVRHYDSLPVKERTKM
ncbi:hypothetical protein N7470_001902 [Penicillium chermesinum]|nr:hypothetical protein N7470_001902 [Penicillium chermesinum]